MEAGPVIDERTFPHNYDRAATALWQSRRLLHEADAELHVALRILGGLDEKELPASMANGSHHEWLHNLMNALMMLEASERTIEEAWPLP